MPANAPRSLCIVEQEPETLQEELVAVGFALHQGFMMQSGMIPAASTSLSSTSCLHRQARHVLCATPTGAHTAPCSGRSAGYHLAPAQPRRSEAREPRFVRLQVSSNGATATAEKVDSSVPKPVVKIDNVTDPFATKVTVEFGDKLGELLDTVSALKNLGLNIRKAKVVSESGRKVNTFFITDAETSEKVVRSARLEEIRMTIINNMLYFHPESSGDLAAGKPMQPSSRDPTSPLGLKARTVVQTTIEVEEAANGTCSVLSVKTRDRPGLLVDIVQTLKDINVNVVSAEVDTIGEDAIDEFFVTYHGEPLNPPMVQLVTNALQYYLSLNEVATEESY